MHMVLVCPFFNLYIDTDPTKKKGLEPIRLTAHGKKPRFEYHQVYSRTFHFQNIYMLIVYITSETGISTYADDNTPYDRRLSPLR